MTGRIGEFGTVLLALPFVACSATEDVPRGAARAASGGASGNTHAGGTTAIGGASNVAGQSGGGAGGAACAIHYPEGVDPDDEFADIKAYTVEPLASFCDRHWCPPTLADATDHACCDDWDPARWYTKVGCGYRTVGYNESTHAVGAIFDSEDTLVGAYYLDDVADDTCGVFNQYGGLMPEPCFDIFGAGGAGVGGGGGWEPVCTSAVQEVTCLGQGGSAGQGGTSG